MQRPTILRPALPAQHPTWTLNGARFGFPSFGGKNSAQTEAAEPASLFQAFCALFGPKESGDEAVTSSSDRVFGPKSAVLDW